MNHEYRINDTETVVLCRHCVSGSVLSGLWKRAIGETPNPCERCGYEPEAPVEQSPATRRGTKMKRYNVNGATIEAGTKAEAARRWAEATYQWPFDRTTAKPARMGWYTIHYSNHGTSTVNVRLIPKGITIR